MDKELDEALADVDLGRHFPLKKTGEVLARHYRSSLSTIRAQEEEIAGLKKEALEARTHARGIEITVASMQEHLIVANARCKEALDGLGRI